MLAADRATHFVRRNLAEWAWNPLQSATIMLAFGLGTAPAVLAGAFGAQRAMRWLGQPRLRAGVVGLFLTFAVLAASGPWIAAHGMAAAARLLPFDCAAC